MIKVIALLRRKPGVTFEEFDRRWKEELGPLAARTITGLRKYTQNHVVKASDDESDIDGIVEMWFDDMAAYEHFVTWRSAEAKELSDSARQFVAQREIRRYVVEEHSVGMNKESQAEPETRIRRIEDNIAVGELLSKYCVALDTQDLDLWQSLWTEDALWATTSRQFRGRDEIRTVLEGNLVTFHDTHHYTINPVITITGDEATAVSDLFYVGTSKSGTPIAGAASYRDRLVRDEGIWRFAERLIATHLWVPWRAGWGIDPASRLVAIP